ncbi:MAG: hypothetical protein JNK75_06245 [Betaproteobacteria bacterium]|nr:hypothetical protein [Betaproteobacteria bacterium]
MSHETKSIPIQFRHGPAETPSDYQGAVDRFNAVRHAAGNDDVHSRALESMLQAMIRLDRQFGAVGALPIEGVSEALDEAMVAAAHVESAWVESGGEAQAAALDHAVIALTQWAMQHELEIRHPEVWVNALARRANAAGTRQDCAAVFALMQGALAHLAPALSADLEQSNPARPWRILILNFAITAIRAGDGALMRFAFDTLNRHLPVDAPGFYAEAAQQASSPGFPEEHRALIDAEVARWTRAH